MRFEYLGSLHPSSSIYFNFISRTISVHEIVSCGRQTAWGTFTECEGGKNLMVCRKFSGSLMSNSPAEAN